MNRPTNVTVRAGVSPRRDRIAHCLRLVACLLLVAAGAAAQRGRVLGRDLRPTAQATVHAASRPAVEVSAHATPKVALSPSKGAALAVLLASAVVPLCTKSRRWRTIQLALDVAVLGVWNGLFLSTARLVGWAGAGLPRAPADLAAALLLLAMAFLYPVFGRASHYCLHACPFGAAQELAGRLPVRKAHLPSALVRRLTTLRRALWAALMLALWCGAWGRWMEWELFGAFAWRAVPPLVVALAVVFIILSAFVPRAYCRFVCPTGTLFKIAESNQPAPSKT